MPPPVTRRGLGQGMEPPLAQLQSEGAVLDDDLDSFQLHLLYFSMKGENTNKPAIFLK